MFKFEEALIYYHLDAFYEGGGICDVNTSIGYVSLDTVRMRCFPPTSLAFPKTAPYFFLRNEGLLYLMKREPQFYA